MSSYLQPHELQHTRLPCPSLHPRVSSNSCPSSNDAIQPSHYLSSPIWPSIFPSTRDFFSESALHIRWRKYWGFSFNISFSDEYSGLISFRTDWLDLLAAQGTLKSVLQHHSLKVSVLWHSAFFTVQLSHPYMSTGKIIALTRWTFVGKVMSLLFNTLSSKEEASFKSMAAVMSVVILEPKKIKSVNVSTFSLSIWHEVMGPDVMILVF